MPERKHQMQVRKTVVGGGKLKAGKIKGIGKGTMERWEVREKKRKKR